MPQAKSKRPTVAERYEIFELLNAQIRNIQEMYNETPNEKLLLQLRLATRLKELWWTDEDVFRDLEVSEMLRHPGEYPYAALIWEIYYRAKENE